MMGLWTFIPSTRLGWLYYLLAASVLAITLVANLKLHAAITRTANTTTYSDGWSEKDFTFLESDYPPSLIPLSQLPHDAALIVEDTVHYQPNMSSDWASLFPEGSGGFVRLGPQGRLFGVSMFHQLHCLDKMRRAVIGHPPTEWESWHTQHCLNYVRQMLLCAASVKIEPVKEDTGAELRVDGLGVEHRCRDWSVLRRAVEDNYQRWSEGDHGRVDRS